MYDSIPKMVGFPNKPIGFSYKNCSNFGVCFFLGGNLHHLRKQPLNISHDIRSDISPRVGEGGRLGVTSLHWGYGKLLSSIQRDGNELRRLRRITGLLVSWSWPAGGLKMEGKPPPTKMGEKNGTWRSSHLISRLIIMVRKSPNWGCSPSNSKSQMEDFLFQGF